MALPQVEPSNNTSIYIYLIQSRTLKTAKKTLLQLLLWKLLDVDSRLKGRITKDLNSSLCKKNRLRFDFLDKNWGLDRIYRIKLTKVFERLGF